MCRSRTERWPKAMSSSRADGIHSELRPHVSPPSRPVFSGPLPIAASYRTSLFRTGRPIAWLMWLGKGKHFLTFPVRAGKLINYVGFVPADAGNEGVVVGARGSRCVCAASSPAGIRASESLLSQVEKTFRWALYDREPLPAWTRGRLTLLGDAAHPMLPHLGQGANQSIEDGMALATILARADRKTAPAGAACLRTSSTRARRAGPARRAREWHAIRLRLCRSWRARCRDHRSCRIPQAALRSRRRAGSASRRDNPNLGLPTASSRLLS